MRQSLDIRIGSFYKAIKTFEEAFQSLDLRQQKAQLQTILKSAQVYKDGKIELEFRGEGS